MNAERLATLLGHLADKHAGRDRVPGRIAHPSDGEQDRKRPESRGTRCHQITQRDPPESAEEQSPLGPHAVRQNPGRKVRERSTDRVDRKQQTNF